MSNKILFCIPARLKSTRLPEKPLLKINGKSIIHHVYDRVQEVKYDKEIVILTDDIKIKNEVDTFAPNTCHIITEECLNGTDRIIKYLQQNTNTSQIIVNVQGDEPFIDPSNIEHAIKNYFLQKTVNQDLVCSTIYFHTFSNIDIMCKSRVKLVLDNQNNIMYGSRNVIPTTKGHTLNDLLPYKIHIGLFVFDKDYLVNQYYLEDTINQLCEDIEWLKILEQGKKINATEVLEHEIGVDTYEDYLYLKDKYENKNEDTY